MHYIIQQHNLFRVSRELAGKIFGDTFEAVKNAVGGTSTFRYSLQQSIIVTKDLFIYNIIFKCTADKLLEITTPTTISSDAWRLWQSTYSNQLLGLKRDIKSLKLTITDAIEK